jgi:hypothetical protein
MDETKSKLKSSTVWTGIITLIVSTLTMIFGADVLQGADAKEISAQIAAVEGLIGTVVMIWRRIAATKKLI